METPSAMATTHDKKKRKKQHKRNKKLGDEEVLSLEKLKTLGDQLLSSRAHINNLPILLSVLSPSSPLELYLEALIPIQYFFLPLVDVIPSKSTIEASEEKDPELVYKVWLRARFDEFVNSLIEIAVDSKSDDALKDVALEAIMDFVKMGKEGKFQTVIYHRLLYNVVHATCSIDFLVDLLVQKYFNYIDVRYFTYTSLDKIAKNCDSGHMKDSKQGDLHSDGQLSKSRIEIAARTIYKILSQVPPLDSLDNKASYQMWSPSGLTSKEAGKTSGNVPDEDPEPEKSKGMNNEVSSIGRILKRIKLKFTNAWLTFLRLNLPLDVYKEVLVNLRQNVIPYMANPAILCDFLTKSYDIGGVISVMALSGLFVLMTQHGLEYPKFYEKLYALLTPAAFMAKHRAVFLQLLDTCLKSSHLPAYLAAAFTKKLSRLALSVPPSGELVIIALIHNLLRRHPSINFLVHKPLEEDDGDAPAEANDSGVDGTHPGTLIMQSKKHGVDPFKCDEIEPSKSDAMRSSLWEIDSLRHHYCPAISRFVTSLENDLTVRNRTSEVTIADFSSGSYATIFKDEMRRRVKQVPLAFYKVTPNTLFCESDFPGWSFGKEESAVKTVEDDGAEPAKRQRINNS